MFEGDLVMIQIPGMDDVSIQFTSQKSSGGEPSYTVKHVRRLAWALSQALPFHAIEHLIYELMVIAQENIIRHARMESAMKQKRLVIAVRENKDSPFPATLNLWFDNGNGESYDDSEDEGLEVDTGDLEMEDDEDE